MKKKTNNEKLRSLMKKHDLIRADVSTLLHLSITRGGQTPAVAKWLAPTTDRSNFRHMSDANLELLELKLGERELTLFKKPRNRHDQKKGKKQRRA